MFALLLPLAAVAGREAGEIDELARDEIRAEAHRDVLREPATVDSEPDVAMVRAVMARGKASVPRLKQDPLPSLQLILQPEGIRAEQLLTLVGGATGYRVENPHNLPLDALVQLSAKPRPISRILAALETQARVSVSLYPEQKLIVVHRKTHAPR